jgi:PAS domain S-box-containing protein
MKTNLKDTGISGLVTVLVAGCILSMAVVAGFYHVALGHVARSAAVSSAESQARLRSSYALIESLSLTQNALQSLLREKDPDVLERLIDDLDARQVDLSERIDGFGASGSAVSQSFGAWRTACKDIVATFLRGENAEANSALVNRLMPESEKVLAQVKRVNDLSAREADGRTAEMSASMERLRYRAVAAVAIAATLITAGGLALRRLVARGTGAVAEMLGRLTSLHAANQVLEARVKERTAEIQRSNAQMKAIHEASLDGVLVLDADWRVIEFNPAAHRSFNCKPGAAVGKPLRELVPVENPASILGKPVEATARRLDGTSFPAEIAITAAAIDQGPPLYVASLRDVTERKRAEAEREELNARLVSASRHAGMAEVATGVLHNVGNVLNSVNVSANVVATKLRDSELSSLTKVVGMIREHKQDLSSFLTCDDRGKLIPEFIADLSDCLDQEHRAMLAEVSTLAQGVEHIKQIVMAQQSLARHGSEVNAPSDPRKLVESALTMQGGSLEREGIEVERRFDGCPDSCAIDAHKVLQILVNLVTNARQAVRSNADDQPRRITLVVATTEQGTLRFQVIDTGAGIAPEHLTRIFSHGFTTKSDGHGFGLHSAANAATEMGGSLRATSEGRGRGATFTLEVPLVAEQSVRGELCQT